MKDYFMQFDYWGDGFNKFYWGIVPIDLSEMVIKDVCLKLIREIMPDIDADSVNIKVAAFNNIN